MTGLPATDGDSSGPTSRRPRALLRKESHVRLDRARRLWANPSERALDCAQDHLERLGYRVLARQFRDCDLIAGRWPLVIACEVRARRIIEPVDDERSTGRKRLRLSASAWLARPENRGFHQVRFDRIDVYLSHGGELVGLEHHPNAF